MNKIERRKALLQYLTDNPFATDDQLALHFGVSVATIRLDRSALHIPQARERTKLVAAGQHDVVRSLEQQEVVGEIVELQLNKRGVSIFHALPPHVFSRSEIVRGHFLFGHVNSLAIAVMDADMAVTAKSELRFNRPVRLGETLKATVDVVAMKNGIAKCSVQTESQGDVILDGFIWVAQDPYHLKTLQHERIGEE